MHLSARSDRTHHSKIVWRHVALTDECVRNVPPVMRMVWECGPKTVVWSLVCDGAGPGACRGAESLILAGQFNYLQPQTIQRCLHISGGSLAWSLLSLLWEQS